VLRPPKLAWVCVKIAQARLRPPKLVEYVRGSAGGNVTVIK